MKSVWHNNHKVCDLTPIEYDALCLLLPYWGLQLNPDGETISGALSKFVIGIQGLTQQKVKELDQLLHHTGIAITTDDSKKCDQRFYVDFHEGHPMPLALNTPEKQLYYLNPATSFRLPVQAAIHKRITLKRKDGPLFLAVKPEFEKQVAEWISYLVIQSFLRFSFESLASISEPTFTSCANKILNHVNSNFADVQIPKSHNSFGEGFKSNNNEQTAPSAHKEVMNNKEETKQAVIPSKHPDQKVTVPPIRPFSASGSLITNHIPKPFEQGDFISQNAQPINPFKSSPLKKQPIQPFNGNQNKNQKSVIRPFQSNQNTPSINREYNDKASRIFRQRRDGK
ncbi:hypothetical protein ABE41_008720 [Fictibacillus arsenicus]|uniref:Uncharacterized protein n=1 Tax=Fictibacillus arsenicus TaxID=255247 RepID=A0A1B1Z3S3_9BACL|nr:hypothetical protein [Fictibacillus arsenicus]ANX12088.1 hypothetical protein ABE41_008720 [Fictibacillus arsenicus]